MKFVIPVTMFSFSYYTSASFAITRESGLTGTEIGSLSIGAISIDVADGRRGGAFIDIYLSKIIDRINRHRSPTLGNLDAEILEFFFGLLDSGIRANFDCGIRNPEHWNPKYSSGNPKSRKKKSAYRSLL